jgi:uncharacterized membrane protein YfcA
VTDASAVDLLVLAIVGVIAGSINTVAGAGSLLLLPALIFTGLDADDANATNRIGILVGAAAALIGYRRAGLAIGRRELALTFAAMIGGGIGAFVATLLAADDVRIAIVVAMGVMLVLSLIPPRKSAPPAGIAATPAQPITPAAPSPALPPPTAGMLLAFVAIGTYGGFLQAGLGIVVLLYLSMVHRVPLVASNVVKSTVTLALTVVAIAVFAWRGERIDLVRGGVLAIASAIGGLVGARATVELGERFVRIAIAVVVLASMIQLLVDPG